MLGKYRKADFLDASDAYGVTEHISAALRALARELDSGGTQTGRRLSDRPSRTNRKAAANDWRGEASSVLALVQRSPFFESSRTLVDLARSLGLALNAKPKDSRLRLAQKLAAFIESLPSESRDRVLSDLLAARNSQTHGWVNVIKGSR
jgi:hypothetical protein